ncbi:MAG: Rieske 2Fe-2S domain-containing protein [Methanomassiliicoccales archaeon]|jgi:3-phenylpropionate/trans-cinnamate dioxygenase ferredoxin subunit
MSKVNVGKRSEYPLGTMKGFSLDSKDVLVANVNGSFYAIREKCSHKGGDLAKGKLIGYTVRCPVHGSEFDLRTGQVVKNVRIPFIGKAADLKVFKVSVEGEDVFVEV